MTLSESLLAEFQREAQLTRKMLERLPDGKFDYKPHDKSMSLGKLSSHIADIPNWVGVTIETEELDFADFEYKPFEANTRDELLKAFDGFVANAVEVFKRNDDEKLMGNWTMKNGDQVYFTMPKAAVLREFVFNHNTHHRGQLSVYLRMNDVPLPSIYGPTADEGSM
ncbi:MAG: DinB family protein [Bacteroidetes bacterium]|nr:DinB family protein [Bacteroidota bacterium]